MRNRKKGTPLPEHYHFPPELLNEVLGRLPPKTLLRFRCVCKSWCSLIDSPDFINFHLHLYPNNCNKTQLFVKEKVPKTCYETVITIRRSDTFRKVSQCVKIPNTVMGCRSNMVHGLMLMKSICDELSLWNPSIQKLVKLPFCPFKFDYADARCMLGFSPLSNDYKVVFCKLIDTTAFEVGIAVYSLRGDCWRVKNNRLMVSKCCFDELKSRRGAIFVQGFVYYRPNQCWWYNKDKELLCFDFDGEEFTFLKLLEMEVEMYRMIFAFGGSLGLLGVSSVRTCIWKLEKNDGVEPWRPYWNGDTNLDVYAFYKDSSNNYKETMYIEHTGKLLLQSMKKLIAYDFRSNQTKRLGKSIPLRYVDTYVESLVLHKGHNDAASTSHG